MFTYFFVYIWIFSNKLFNTWILCKKSFIYIFIFYIFFTFFSFFQEQFGDYAQGGSSGSGCTCDTAFTECFCAGSDSGSFSHSESTDYRRASTAHDDAADDFGSADSCCFQDIACSCQETCVNCIYKSSDLSACFNTQVIIFIAFNTFFFINLLRFVFSF